MFSTLPSFAVCVRLSTHTGVCYAQFEERTEQTQRFVVNDTETGRVTEYDYSTGLGELEGLFGYGPNYGDGGYTEFLPALSRSEAGAVLDRLYDDVWLNASTRAVAVHFSLYNTNTR